MVMRSSSTIRDANVGERKSQTFLNPITQKFVSSCRKKKKKKKKKKKNKKKDFFQLVEVKGLTCQMLPPIQLFEHIDKIAIYFSLFFSTTI